MRRQRLIATTFLFVALGCSDDERAPVALKPTPRLEPSLTALDSACTYSDDPVTKVRTVTAGCDNRSLSVPDGWTVRLTGTPAPATMTAPLAATASSSASSVTPIDNPDADYFNATSLIDISSIPVFAGVSSITDGTQTIGFSAGALRLQVPSTWATWSSPPFSESGAPAVLYFGPTSVTWTLSQPVSTFGFEAEPNPFSTQTITANFYSGAQLVGSVSRAINGYFGARLMAAAVTGTSIDRVQISSTSDFGVAEVRYGGIGDRAAALARGVVGAPYLGNGTTWGGKGWDYPSGMFVPSARIFAGYTYWNNAVKQLATGKGVDCSGLVLWSYDRAFDPPRIWTIPNVVAYEGADGQYRYNSVDVSASALKRGDLLFFRPGPSSIMTHVAMYVGGGQIVGAFDPQHGIISGLLTEAAARPSFVAFRRITNPRVNFAAQAASPVELAVTDPDGFTITAQTFIVTPEEHLREIPGVLYYSEAGLGAEGQPSPRVYSPVLKTGDYFIMVVPRPTASVTDVYSLVVTASGTTIVLADHTPIGVIPALGYGIQSSPGGTVTRFVPVAIDIKPGSDPASINLGSNGTTPVAILSSKTFDARTVDPTTVKLADAPVALRPNGSPMASFEDVNGDGLPDLVVHVLTSQLQLSSDAVKASLVGKTFAGELVKGSDDIVIVPSSSGRQPL